MVVLTNKGQLISSAFKYIALLQMPPLYHTHTHTQIDRIVKEKRLCIESNINWQLMTTMSCPLRITFAEALSPRPVAPPFVSVELHSLVQARPHGMQSTQT